MTYKAVIFDLDGTLLDTLSDLANSANHVLSELSLPTHEKEKYKYFVGNGIPKLIERCLPSDRQELHEKALSMFLSYYKNHSRDLTAPYDGIKEMLETLKKAGLKLAVLTNKAHSVSCELMEYYFGKGVFDYVRGLDETIKPKPDSKGALMTASALGVSPSEVFYCGDSGVDMQTAVNAGFFPCGVLWGFRKKDELCENGAQLTVNTPKEITEYLLTGE